MAETIYRAYMLDESDHVVRAIELDAVSDEDAKTQAIYLMDGCDIEIWKGIRIVARLPRNNAVSKAPAAFPRAGRAE